MGSSRITPYYREKRRKNPALAEGSPEVRVNPRGDSWEQGQIAWQKYLGWKKQNVPRGAESSSEFQFAEGRIYASCFGPKEVFSYKLLGGFIDWAKSRQGGLSITAAMYPDSYAHGGPEDMSSPLIFAIYKGKEGFCAALLREDSFHHGYVPYHAYKHYAHLGKNYTLIYPEDLFLDYCSSADRFMSSFFTQFTFSDHETLEYSDGGVSVRIPSSCASMSLFLESKASGSVRFGMASAFDSDRRKISEAFRNELGGESLRPGHYYFTYEGKTYLITEQGEVNYLLTGKLEIQKKFLEPLAPEHAKAEAIAWKFFSKAQGLIAETAERCGAERIAGIFRAIAMG